MKLFPGRSNRVLLASLALVGVGAIGCHDADTAPKIIQTPNGPMRDLGTVIFDVDVKHGTVTARPQGSPASTPVGLSARFFGSTTEIEYLRHEQSQGVLGGGVFEFNIHLGVSNLLDFPIGTNANYTYPDFPEDTLGIYVYYVYPPFNVQKLGDSCPEPTCTVTIDSADGTYPFTNGLPQKYVYFKSILEGGGTNAPGPGPFETDQSGLPGGFDYDRRLSFLTTGDVEHFSFGLAMAAAWADPHESRWKVFYIADSLPNRLSLDDLRSEPDWRRLGSTGSASITPGGCTPNTGACSLTLVSALNDTVIYYRSDSLRATQSAYIAATVTTSSLTVTDPGVFMGLKDPDKIVQMGIANGLTGFTDSTGAFIPTFTVVTDLNRTSYRVAKFTSDSAAIYSPAGSLVPLVKIPYASLPPAPVRGSGPPNYDRFFFFGNLTASPTSASATSIWSDVNYEIGAAAP